MIEKSPKAEIKPAAAAPTAPTKGEASSTEARAQSTRESQMRLFEVEIAGVPLRLKSSHDEQTVNELVALVDQKVREALPLTKTGSIQNASILASLHLAEEYLTLKRKAKAELERLEKRTLKVISDLESSRMTGLQSKDDRVKSVGYEADRDSEKRDISQENAFQQESAIDL